MDTRPGTEQRPLRVAIIGAGPSAFYAAEALLAQTHVQVSIDMFERKPTPFGLVRDGVAPDHQKIKSVTRIYDRVAASPAFRFFGNVTFGVDISLAELRRYYDAVIYAVGAQSDRRLGIPGEDLVGSYPATIFVGWYNGHPDYADLQFDLTVENVAVIGQGNVAVDVTRILAKSPEELASTDIADYAVAKLRTSTIRTITMIGRRGPAQAAFTNAEIKELGELDNAEMVVDPADLELDEYSQAALASDKSAARNVAILSEHAHPPRGDKPRQVHVRFLRSPVEIIGENGRVTAIRLQHNRLVPTQSGDLKAVGTDQYETIPVGLVFRSVGYRGVPLPDVPFDQQRGTIPNALGRVLDPASQTPRPGEYVVGWAKRGPSGIIGTNKPDSLETVKQLLADVPSLEPAPEGDPAAIEALIRSRKPNYVSYQDWSLLDRLEVERGQPHGRPRLKFTRIAEMLDAIKDRR